MEGKFVGK